jgi:hypothetical protein
MQDVHGASKDTSLCLTSNGLVMLAPHGHVTMALLASQGETRLVRAQRLQKTVIGFELVWLDVLAGPETACVRYKDCSSKLSALLQLSSEHHECSCG